MSDQNAVTLRQKLESMIVQELQEKLKAGKITGDRAKEIAKIVLEVVPEDIAKEDLVNLIPQLDNNISELAGVVYKILSERDSKTKTESLKKLREMLKQAEENYNG
jgi:phosphate uptake regulator